ncbi:MAG TPA: MBL fold metallo-hydrolase [Casimicrobiaceae bacterium]|nr:MBL fold metallo-hydrolase [Casimicrobiaceae bacterium]
MQIGFFGASGTVTGSRYLLEAAGKRVLVDCGLFQGLKQLRLRNWAPFPVDPASIDAVVLTHAHLDHSGNLPLLVRDGFKGRIHCTDATQALCEILLPDSAHLLEEEAERANRYGYSKHRPALPLYTGEDVGRALQRFQPERFEREFEPVRGVRVRFLHAGHILGAAMAVATAEGRSILFTGDVGRPQDLIMRAPAAAPAVDYLVVESTYGDRRHPGVDPGDELAEVIRRTIARGGIVVVPSFAVARAQALLYLIHQLKAAGRLPESLPVYLNSPMATDVTGLYEQYRSEHRLTGEQTRAMCNAAKFVNSVEESKALNEGTWPRVIIAASGMATGGRVLHHLRAFAPDARNTILFTGYQAAGTRGRAMIDGATEIKMFGEYVPVRAEVARLDSMSAHADHAELVEWMRAFPRAPRRIFVTHGEPVAADAMRLHIEESLRWRCTVPEHLERVDLND